jgi:hypothetical protein
MGTAKIIDRLLCAAVSAELVVISVPPFADRWFSALTGSPPAVGVTRVIRAIEACDSMANHG